MRLRPAILAAAAFTAAGPAALRAQSQTGVPYGTYAGQGCGTGRLTDLLVDDRPVFGTVVCVVGTFTFTYFPSVTPGDGGGVRLDANTVITFNPALTARSVGSNGLEVFGQFPADSCPAGLSAGICRGVLASTPGIPAMSVPGPNERRITAFGSPVPRNGEVSRATFDSVRFYFEYPLEGGPGPLATVTFAFTPVPEPSTFALAAAGVLAGAAGARARRRRDPAGSAG
jgi:hypothetical protein